MKSLGEIHWDIDHQCREENISTSDESMMLFHAAEEYVEELLKHDRWKFIIKSDIESLKVSSFIRREIKGYSHGAEMLLSYTIREIERFGYNINDIIDPITHELTNPMIQGTTQNENIPKTGDEAFPIFDNALKKLFKTEENYSSFCKKFKGLNPEDIASSYCDMSGVLNPRKRGVARTLYDKFVNPKKKEDMVVYETFLRYLRKAEGE